MADKQRVAVLGAGAGGIAMGVRLGQAGYDYTIFEKSHDVGGTWLDNTYPGAACDVPSHLYSYSFAPNPEWSQTYANQPEILAYLQKVATDFGVREHVRTGTQITEARWDDATQQWTLSSAAGETFTADVLVSALGMLNVPHVPDIPGQQRFRGRAFHSSRWEHDAPVDGARVASIGTGASAIQYVPAIAGRVEHLTVFQRTPIWVTPRIEGPYTPEQKAAFARSRFASRKHRWQIFMTYQRASFDATAKTTTTQTSLAREYLARKVADEELRALLTPDFPVGCKRPLSSRTWFPALTQPNVRLVTAPITELTEHGVRTADGEEHRVDTLIYGTGFHANDYLRSLEVYGTGGRRLHDDWADGAEAYRGISVAGYPNLFLLYGPNTNGVNSILFMHEAQANYVMKALATMRRRRLASVDVRRDVMDAHNARLQAAMAGTVWLAGCNNYYAHPSGKIVTQLPYSGGRYWWQTRTFPARRYVRRRQSA